MMPTVTATRTYDIEPPCPAVLLKLEKCGIVSPDDLCSLNRALVANSAGYATDSCARCFEDELLTPTLALAGDLGTTIPLPRRRRTYAEVVGTGPPVGAGHRSWKRRDHLRRLSRRFLRDSHLPI